jgi:hypothetical protein
VLDFDKQTKFFSLKLKLNFFLCTIINSCNDIIFCKTGTKHQTSINKLIFVPTLRTKNSLLLESFCTSSPIGNIFSPTAEFYINLVSDTPTRKFDSSKLIYISSEYFKIEFCAKHHRILISASLINHFAKLQIKGLIFHICPPLANKHQYESSGFET